MSESTPAFESSESTWDFPPEDSYKDLGALLMKHQPRLWRIVHFRMDGRLRGRVDASDILQETFLEATRRIDRYRAERPMPFFLWLRFLTLQKVCEVQRRHLGVAARDATREIALWSGPTPEVSSAVLAANLAGNLTSPSRAAMRAESQSMLEIALNAMEPIDRETIALRHFEWLSNAEVAQCLGISESAASNRYVRALKRLRRCLKADRPASSDRSPEKESPIPDRNSSL